MKGLSWRRLALWVAVFLLAVGACLAVAATAYHGNRNSRIFHGVSCRYYDCKNCVVVFATRQAALAAGYRPCKVCRP